MWSLKPSDKVIDLLSDSEDAKPQPPMTDDAKAALMVLSHSEETKPQPTITDASKAAMMVPCDTDKPLPPVTDAPEPSLMLEAPAVKEVSSTGRRLRAKTCISKPTPPKVQGKNKRGEYFIQKWAAHEGHGFCKGLRGPCVMGIRGAAARAGPSGLCDLCNLNDIALLHHHGQGRLTHLLLQLAAPEADQALACISTVDNDIAKDLRHRMDRARHRKDPNRPRRGPRSKKTIKQE
ncbi:pif1 [Symbiodinium sp. CCMP2592]|nr:pif1 [Symbiodinium sp. CCMP2592]